MTTTNDNPLTRPAFGRVLTGTVALALVAALSLAAGRAWGDGDGSDAEALRAKIDALIGRLGAEGYKDREQATRELEAIGAPAVAALERTLAESPDQEVRSRAARLLQTLRPKPEPGTERPKPGEPGGAEEDPATGPDSPEKMIERLRERMSRMPGLRFEMSGAGNQHVVVVEANGDRHDFSRDATGRIVVVVTRGGVETRHEFKDEAELKAKEPALHEVWRTHMLEPGVPGGPGADDLTRMMELQRRMLERMMGGPNGFDRLLARQRRLLEEQLRGLDGEALRKKLEELRGGPGLDREAFDRLLEGLRGPRSLDEVRKTVEDALRALERKADGGEPDVEVPAPAEPAPARDGLRFAAPSEVLREQLGLEGGAVVVETDPNGPFGASGLARHDVVVELGGQPVAGPEVVGARLAELAKDQAVSAVVLRRGKRLAVELVRK